MAKKKKRNSGNNITATAFKFIRIGALLGPGVYRAMYAWEMDHDLSSVARHLLSQYTGYDCHHGTWKMSEVVNGYGPYIMANVMTRIVPRILNMVRKIF